MEMPDKYTINPDGSLTVYVDSQEYVFSKNQFLKSDKGRILLKHQAVAMLAEMTGVKVREPVLLSNYNPVIYVFSRTAVRGNETLAELRDRRKRLIADDDDEKCIDELRKVIAFLEQSPKAIIEYDHTLFEGITDRVIVEENVLAFELKGGIVLREAIAWN